ncbi:hypothetical protein B2D07_12300 [Desulfococcus multivorans]|nr:hypothetical protein B2D07_12300 [Desulfococcus multivorans]
MLHFAAIREHVEILAYCFMCRRLKQRITIPDTLFCFPEERPFLFEPHGRLDELIEVEDQVREAFALEPFDYFSWELLYSYR